MRYLSEVPTQNEIGLYNDGNTCSDDVLVYSTLQELHSFEQVDPCADTGKSAWASTYRFGAYFCWVIRAALAVLGDENYLLVAQYKPLCIRLLAQQPGGLQYRLLT